jgi:L-alanine-DL-glutamate epimerase-like enolase superfamily enzyme
MTKITSVDVEPLCIELCQPFGISGGTQTRADNVLVRVHLDDGTTGLGEAAPFTAFNGETQALALATLRQLTPELQGRSVAEWRPLFSQIEEYAGASASAACAVQSALLDAWLKSHRCSMWSFFGGAEPELTSDITVPTGGVDDAVTSTQEALAMGFDVLKVKVGGGSLDRDAERLFAIGRAAPKAQLVLDANAAYSAEDALRLLDLIGNTREQVRLFEQPTAADDLDGLRQVMLDARIDVAADESARNATDILRLAKARAVSTVNVKIMKSGISESMDMVTLARRHGLKLMIGGMVESELAMSVSACLAAGMGGFSWVDLDTPLFMQNTPFVGGFERRGKLLRVSGIEAGHGVTEAKG